MVRNYDYHRKSIGEGYYAGRKKKKRPNRLVRSLFFLVFIAVAIALFVYVFPEVEVTLVPDTETVTNDFEFIVSTEAKENDIEDNILRGRIVEVEAEIKRTFPATGEKNIGEKAIGEALFFNQTGLVQPLTSENALVNDDGTTFFVTSAIDIPKAEVSAEGNIVFGTKSVNIIAGEAGESGNIDPGRLTIIDLAFSKQNKIYAEVKKRPEGGVDKIVKVVSEDDLANAEDEIMEDLYPVLVEKINKEINEDEVWQEDLLTYEVISREQAVELEEEVDEFEIKIIARARTLVWDESDIRALVVEKISNLGTGKQLIETSQDIFEVKVVDGDVDQGEANITVHAVNQITKPIDLTSLKSKIVGKTEFEARRILLEDDNIRDVRFKFRYSISNNIPKNTNRIILELSK